MAASDLIGDVLTKIFTSSDEAEAYSEAPHDYLVAEGLGDIDLSGIDMGECVAQVANELNLDNSVTTTLIEVSEPVPAGPVLSPLAPAAAPAPAPAAAPSGGGGSAPAPAPAAAPAPAPVTSLEQIQQIVNNYTTVVYEGDETITNNLFDNSQTLELDFEDVEGDIDLDLDMDAVNANGAGAVAAGDDIENSNIASGEGAVAFDGTNDGVILTGENTGIVANESTVEDTIIGDGNAQTGDGDNSNAISGDGNTVNQVDGSDNVIQSGDGNENTQVNADEAVVGDNNQAVQGEDNTAGFGSGDVANFGENNDFGEAQIGFGGSTNQDNDAENVGNTTIDQETNIADVGNTDIEDNSTNDSFNADVDTTIEDSFDNETTDSFNEAENFDATQSQEDSSEVEEILED